MSRLVILVLIQAALSFGADITVDLNCTYSNTAGKSAYTRFATICNDKSTTDACKQMFGGGAVSAVATDATDQRPFQCFSTVATGPIDSSIKSAAIDLCPKFCGYCCQTPAYNCQNKQFPRVNCNTVTSEMCGSMIWRQILAEDCPNICGFCQDNGCIDIAVDCANDISICNGIDTQDFVNQYCRKTCGRCSSTPAPSPDPCFGVQDSSTNCAAWNSNGFCASNFYTREVKKKYCAKTCNICD